MSVSHIAATLDWQKVEEAKLREIVRMGELYLSAQLTRFQQGDQRGTSLLSVCSSSSLALTGGGFALVNSNSSLSTFGFALIAGGLCFSCGALLSMLAITPTHFYLTGNRPQFLLDKEDLESRPVKALLVEYAEHYDDAIVSNRRSLETRQRRLRAASILVFAAVATTVVVASLIWISFSDLRLVGAGAVN